MRRLSSPSSPSSTASDGSASTIDISLDDDPPPYKVNPKAQLGGDMDFDFETPLLDELDENADDEDLPPPSKLFIRKVEKEKSVVKKKDGGNEEKGGALKGGGVRIKLNTHPRRPLLQSPSPSPPRLPKFDDKFVTTSTPFSRPKPNHYNPPFPPQPKYQLNPKSQSRYSSHHNLKKASPILCCDLAKTSPNNPRFSALVNNFISLGQETAYGREIARTSVVEKEQSIILMLQQGKVMVKNEQEGYQMGWVRWFVPVMPTLAISKNTIPDSEDDTDTDAEMGGVKLLDTGNSTLKDDREGGDGLSLFNASHSVTQHLALIERNLTRDLMDMESHFNADPFSLSARRKVLVPRLAGTSADSGENRGDRLFRIGIEKLKERMKEQFEDEWQQGQLGFKELFFTNTPSVSGDGKNKAKGENEEGAKSGLRVLADFLTVEGRAGHMQVRCWDCEKDWVLSVREKAMTL